MEIADFLGGWGVYQSHSQKSMTSKSSANWFLIHFFFEKSIVSGRETDRLFVPSLVSIWSLRGFAEKCCFGGSGRNPYSSDARRGDSKAR